MFRLTKDESVVINFMIEANRSREDIQKKIYEFKRKRVRSV